MNKELVLVYQMGKVGSTTIFRNIQRRTAKRVFLVHYLRTRVAEDIIKKTSSRVSAQAELARLAEVRQLVDSEVSSGQKIKVITGVREPIARNISAYFQNIGHQRVLSAGSLQADFISNYPHEIVLNWFDSEYKVFTGVDVYETPFDKEQGWAIVDSSGYRTLIYRQENLREIIANRVIQNFLGRPDLDFCRRYNQGCDKEYASEYDVFKRNFNPTPSFAEKFFNSKYCRHFYTESELEKFRKTWYGVSP